MKSPDEIKKGLEHCRKSKPCVDGCPYIDKADRFYTCEAEMLADALALIQKIEDQNAELRKRLDDLKEVARGNYEWCKHNDFGQESDICKKCVHFSWENDPDDNWELDDTTVGTST